MRENGNLRTIDDLENEQEHKADKLVANLASLSEVKDRHIHDLECKYNETTVSLDKMMELKEQLLQSYNEGLF